MSGLRLDQTFGTRAMDGQRCGARSLGSSLAADYILITDVQRDTYPKDQPPGMKGAESDMPLTKRWSFEPRTLPKPSTKPRSAFISPKIAHALAGTLIGTFTSVMINSNPALSGNTLSARGMGWFYHTAGVFAFALNAVAQNSMSGWSCLGVRLTLTACKGSGGGLGPVIAWITKIMHHHLCDHKNPPLSNRQAVHRPCLPQHGIFYFDSRPHRGEYVMLGKLGLGAFGFFLLQGFAVSVGTTIFNMLSFSGSSLASPRKAAALSTPTSAKSLPPLWKRIVGYVRVLLWFRWSLPFMVDAGIPAGAYGPHRMGF
ncbi:hypothetical protein K443DRAFT_7417 [Laccaria amethystina LaAM-08-1]|uniref:Uncharacterized protein n=1 Tax=Laccaria amethystina LaAM-08-1 TaxID=1095629 RepID=A0A0C9XSK0_9AGAR|nr:hypothetical protein K443DRAFT_7417 [Laccaria amethystina LaAM-08-1]